MATADPGYNPTTLSGGGAGLPAGTGLVLSTAGVGSIAVAGTDYVAPDVAIASGKKLILDSSASLTTVALQIAGDPNTGIGAVAGADSLSIVAAGREHVRITDGYCGFLLGAVSSHSAKQFYLANAGNGLGDDVSLVFTCAASGFTGNPLCIDGMYLGSGNGYDFRFYTANDAGTRAERLRLTGLGSVVLGAAALATTATSGFLYIAAGAGPPTGVPVAFTGRVPLYWDTTNKKFYVYDGAWLGGTAPGVWS